MNLKVIAVIVISALFVILAMGCLSKDARNGESENIPGDVIENEEGEKPATGNTANVIEKPTDIEKILAGPADYHGKIVTIEGKPSGSPGGETMPQIYTVEQIGSLNKSRFIGVETYNFPKGKMECIRKISVTGKVIYKSESGTTNEVVIVEQSRKVLDRHVTC